MHIVHVVTRLLRGGSEENTVETCRWQRAAGHRVSLIHGAEYDMGWRLDGIEVIGLPELVHPIRPAADLAALRRLRRAFRALRPDVIHTHQSKAGILGRFAARAAPGAVVAHGIHIVPFGAAAGRRSGAYLAVERMAARRTDVFIAVSQAVAAPYLSAGLCRGRAMHVVRSGMALERFRNAAPPDDWREVLGVTAKPPVLVMLAALERRKRHAQFLRAFPRVLERVPDARLILAGAGAQESALRSLIARLGLQRNVILVGHRHDPERWLALADLSVLASAHEGLPRVVVQSLAAGCPPVVCALDGIGEVVRDGRNGAVCLVDDLGVMADRIAEVLVDPSRLATLTAGARATDVADWGWEALGAGTTAAYGRIA